MTSPVGDLPPPRAPPAVVYFARPSAAASDRSSTLDRSWIAVPVPGHARLHPSSATITTSHSSTFWCCFRCLFYRFSSGAAAVVAAAAAFVAVVVNVVVVIVVATTAIVCGSRTLVGWSTVSSEIQVAIRAGSGFLGRSRCDRLQWCAVDNVYYDRVYGDSVYDDFVYDDHFYDGCVPCGVVSARYAPFASPGAVSDQGKEKKNAILRAQLSLGRASFSCPRRRRGQFYVIFCIGCRGM